MLFNFLLFQELMPTFYSLLSHRDAHRSALYEHRGRVGIRSILTLSRAWIVRTFSGFQLRLPRVNYFMPCQRILAGKRLAAGVAIMFIVRMRGRMSSQIILALKHLGAAFILTGIDIDRAVGSFEMSSQRFDCREHFGAVAAAP